jgi:predicted RNase H-like nuclease (RuvC/YqgF family)
MTEEPKKKAVRRTTDTCSVHEKQVAIIATVCEQVKNLNIGIKEIKDMMKDYNDRHETSMKELDERNETRFNSLEFKIAELDKKVEILNYERDKHQRLRAIDIWSWVITVVSVVLLTIDTVIESAVIPSFWGAPAWFWTLILGGAILSGLNIGLLISKIIKKRFGVNGDKNDKK